METIEPRHRDPKAYFYRPKSHGIRIPRLKNLDIEIRRLKSYDTEFLGNYDPFVSGDIRIRIPQKFDVLASWSSNLNVVIFRLGISMMWLGISMLWLFGPGITISWLFGLRIPMSR